MCKGVGWGQGEQGGKRRRQRAAGGRLELEVRLAAAGYLCAHATLSLALRISKKMDRKCTTRAILVAVVAVQAAALVGLLAFGVTLATSHTHAAPDAAPPATATPPPPTSTATDPLSWLWGPGGEAPLPVDPSQPALSTLFYTGGSGSTAPLVSALSGPDDAAGAALPYAAPGPCPQLLHVTGVRGGQGGWVGWGARAEHRCAHTLPTPNTPPQVPLDLPANATGCGPAGSAQCRILVSVTAPAPGSCAARPGPHPTVLLLAGYQGG